MIYDWYNGGDWGGLPVRRAGHIQADMINAFSALYRVVGVTNVIGSHPLGSRAMKKNETDSVSLATDPEALASWFDGVRVGGQAGTGDPMRFNLRVALSILNALCVEAEPDEPQFLQDDLETIVTPEYLGIDGMDAEDPIRPQDMTPWAKVRDAYEALRYLRGPIPVVLLSSAGDGEQGVVWDLASVNASVTSMHAGLSYGEGYSNLVGTYSRAEDLYGPPAVSIASTKWFRFILKGDNGLDSTPLERVPLRAYLKIRYQTSFLASTYQQDFPTNRGDIVVGTGYEETIDDPGDFIQFDSEMSEPILFESGDGIGTVSGVIITRGAYQPALDTASHVIWDLHDEDAS